METLAPYFFFFRLEFMTRFMTRFATKVTFILQMRLVKDDLIKGLSYYIIYA